ncbi:MAG: helix-turn-helix domain-containing protein, partial [Candidatus Thorarchaeota archaeon]
VLRPLVKMGIIATGWVEGLSSEVIYLTRALFVLRTVSQDIIRAVREGDLPKDVAESYLESSKEYHRDYAARLRNDLFKTVWSDAEEIGEYILDFDTYDLIQALRRGPAEVKQLPELIGLSKAKIKKKLSSLEKANIIKRIKDGNKREHVILKCNPEVVTVYPEWLIQRTVDQYNSEAIASQQAMHYLEILKQSHPSQATLLAELE